MANKLEIKLLLSALDKVSAPFKKIRAAGGHTTEQLKQAQQRIKSLNKQSSKIDGYRKISKSLGITSVQLKNAQAHVKHLAQQIDHSKAPSKALTKEFEQARASTIKLITQAKQLTATKHKQRNALREAGIDTKNLASHQRTLTHNLAHANKQLAAQKKHLHNVAQQQKQLNKARNQLDNRLNLQTSMATKGAMGAGGGAAALYATSQFLQPGLEFTAAQSKVQALTRLDENDPALKALRKQARNLGATTQFTANDVSMGQSYLAMAGFDAKAIQQAMPGMLDLSIANGTDLAVTSDIASNILSGFGLQADQMGRLGDVLTATTTRANVNLTMLGETMKYVAPAARDLGIGIEEAAAMSGLLGNVGIQASQGGTVLRAMLNRLSSQTGPAAKAMEVLGLNTKDAGGNLRAIPSILQDVVKATAKMGNADRAGILKTIFGEEAGTGVSELIKQQGDGAIKAFTDVLKNAAGENANVAKVMANNAKGDLQSLASAWDDVGIELFEGNDSGIRTLIQDVTGVVRSIGNWMKANPELTSTLFKVAAAAAALATIGGTLTVMIAGLIGPIVMTKYALSVMGIKHLPLASKGFKLVALGVGKFSAILKGAAAAVRIFSLALISSPIGWVIAGISALITAGYLLITHWDSVSAFFSKTWQSLKAIVSVGVAKTLEVIRIWPKALKAIFNWAPLSIVAQKFNAVKNWLIGLWPSITNTAQTQWQKLKNVFNWSPLQSIANGFNSAKNWLNALWPNIKTTAANSWKLFKTVFDWSPLGMIINNFGRIKNWFASLWSSVTTTADKGWQTFKTTFDWSPLNTISNSFGTVKSWLSSLWPSITTNAQSQWQHFKSVFNWSPLQSIAGGFNSVKTWLSNLWPNINSTADAGWQNVKAVFNWSPLNTISNGFSAVKSWLSSLWPSITANAQSQWQRFKSVFNWSPLASIAGGFNSVKTWLNNLWPNINSTAAAGWQNVKAVFDWSPLNTISNGFSAVKSWLNSLWPSITINTQSQWQNFKSIFNWSPLASIAGGFNSVKTWLNNLWPNINSTAAAGWQNVKAVFDWSPLNTISNGFSAVKSWLNSLWPSITANAQSQWQSFKAVFNWSPLGSITRGFNSVKTWLSSLWPNINSTAAAGWQNVKAVFSWSPLNTISSGFSAVKSWLSSLWPSITTNAQSQWQNFKSIFNWPPLASIAGGFNSVKIWLNNLWPNINSTAAAGWQNFKSLFDWSPLSVITSHFNSVISFFTNLPNKFVSLGEMTIDGFGNGIKNKLQLIKDSIFGIGKSAIASLKQTLGIASPSKVFATLGDQTMQGLNVGIQRSQNEPLKQVNALSKTLAGTAFALGAVSLPAAAQPANFAKAEQPTFVSGSQLYQPNQKQAVANKQPKTIHIDASIHAPITIHATQGTNEQDIARQVVMQIEQYQRNQQAKIRATLGDIE
ncbi:phage tail tape measure protein [Pseudoalteromonas sp. MMG013]|uniref:phage tail tape measure protein n=1 Tax=Pseudoalteromonas sp. MMG013 TaxID=2822687 RepID=UPI001B3877E4|nr:phage tail tape measure protein [Pseudoalteromonas sp. MMG013]MBQ4864593.1 phage tail tape measure protein [Pseudoalteromonas sp. MMG013]